MTPSQPPTAPEAVPAQAQRITDYLAAGGLFNPECMDHDKVRDLLMECREDIIESAKTIAIQHRLMVTAEQRGDEKAREDLGQKAEAEIPNYHCRPDSDRTTPPPAPDLTAEGLRVAVAKCLGWHDIRLSERWEATDPPDEPIVLCGRHIGHIGFEPLPDFCNDLNACATFEATLTPAECYQYQGELCRLCGEWNPHKGVETWLWHASPIQRCRAFLAVKEGR